MVSFLSIFTIKSCPAPQYHGVISFFSYCTMQTCPISFIEFTKSSYTIQKLVMHTTNIYSVFILYQTRIPITRGVNVLLVTSNKHLKN